MIQSDYSNHDLYNMENRVGDSRGESSLLLD